MIDTVSFGRLKNLVDRLERDDIKDEEEISFEFVIANCFPLVYDNIKQELTKKYIEGFAEGVKK
jgi:hypothetical protein